MENQEKQQFAISEWQSAKQINKELKHLQSVPAYSVGKENYEKIVADYYEGKCPKSKAIFEEAKNYIPGGVQHNLAFNKPFPVCFAKAKGAYLTDIDGNEYIDFLQAGGPTILGSNNDTVREEVKKLLDDCGPVTGLLHEAEMLLAKEINKHMPAVEMFRMLGSGTEGVMAAIRVSRVITHKKRVIKVGGAYHGWSDQMVYGLKVPGTRQYLESHGIPGSYKTTDEVRPNDLGMLEHMLKKNKMRGGTAAVIVEPVGPESGTRPIDEDYNEKARLLARKYGALFIFDEVVTGFRLGLSGASGYFFGKFPMDQKLEGKYAHKITEKDGTKRDAVGRDMYPDLVVFGKVIAGGYPAAGGVGGKREYVKYMSSGLGKGEHRAYVGGTLAANPLSSLAGYLTIKEIEKTDACVKAGRAGDRLCKGLKELIAKYNLPYVAYNQGSIVHLECTGAMSYDYSSTFLLKSLIGVLKNKSMIKQRATHMEYMGAAYMANGIVTLAGSRLYTSLADTDEVIDEALRRFDKVFALVVNTGECDPNKKK